METIALYLSGKLSPFYGKGFDKLEFLEILRMESQKGFSSELFRLVDSNDFYLMCLNRVQRADKESLISVLRSLKIPEFLVAESQGVKLYD